MGFIPDVRRIIHRSPHKDNRQTLFYSATMTDDVQRLASQWTKNAITSEIEPEQVTVDTVTQIIYIVTEKEKFNLLFNLLQGNKIEKAIVFANMRSEARNLEKGLTSRNISCDLLSGEVSQKRRLSTLNKFKNGNLRVLVATDVAGRGIHVDGISHVINFTLPHNPEDYVHRIGRTGRAGKLGVSISFACEEDSFNIPAIEEFIGEKIVCSYPDEALLR